MVYRDPRKTRTARKQSDRAAVAVALAEQQGNREHLPDMNSLPATGRPTAVASPTKVPPKIPATGGLAQAAGD